MVLGRRNRSLIVNWDGYLWICMSIVISDINMFNDMDYFDDERDATQSASHEEVATTDWFIDFQAIAEPASRNTWPSVDFRVCRQPAQSESQYSMISKLDCPLYVSPKFRVLLMYLNTRLTEFQCVCTEDSQCCASLLTANYMSGLVPSDKYIKETIAYRYSVLNTALISTGRLVSPFTDWSSIGAAHDLESDILKRWIFFVHKLFERYLT